MLNNEPLVSVIMPAYNVGRYIAESIESVRSQTYANWELIIVDDGSTDDTAAIIKNYQRVDDRISYYPQANSGQSNARSKAVKRSQGVYIAFLDADDLWLPEKLSLSISEIRNSECDLLFTDTYYFEDGNDPDIRFLKTNGVELNHYEGKTGVLAFLQRNRIPHLTVVVKSMVLKKAGDYLKIDAAEEYDMWLRLLYHGAVFKSLPVPSAIHRLRNNSLTAKDRLALFETMIVIRLFARQHTEYRKEIWDILKPNFRYWLYHGHNTSNKTYRELILGISPRILSLALYLLSLFLPFYLLRKVTNRTLNWIHPC